MSISTKAGGHIAPLYLYSSLEYGSAMRLYHVTTATRNTRSIIDIRKQQLT